MRPLGTTSRRTLFVVALHHHQHGHAPSWSALGSTLGVSRFKLAMVIAGLERRGLITYTDEPGSLTVTPTGREALGRLEPS